MRKKFLETFCILLIILFSSKRIFAEVFLVSPSYGEILTDPVVTFEWENPDGNNEYIYRHEYSLERNFQTTMAKNKIEETFLQRGLANYNIYYWRVRYHPKDTFDGTYDYVSRTSVFSINKDIPWIVQPEKPEEKEEEPTKEEEEIQIEEIVEVEEENKVIEKKEAQEEVVEIPEATEIKSNKETGEEAQNEFTWDVSSSTQDVLGLSSESTVVCKFKYSRRDKSIKTIFCNIPIAVLTQQSFYAFGNEYSFIIKGSFEDSFNIQVDEYICDFNIFKPSTWFKCNEKLVNSSVLKVSPNIYFDMYQDSKQIPVLSYTKNGKDFAILAGHSDSTNNIILTQTYRIVNSKYNLYYEEKKDYFLNLTDLDTNTGLKPFSFPFSEIVGVTQWYGYTEYQKPHTGIDFGAYRKKVLAIGDGEVISKGWDSYYGECLSGGNYLKIRQENGMYTVYFHLEEIYVNTGDMVRKGDIIALSGNTGSWNCQKLAYHLHFETRLQSIMSSHVNPVDYIDIDWNQVLTLGYLQYPERLSGENPHPGR